jgi:hypothetical protein
VHTAADLPLILTRHPGMTSWADALRRFVNPFRVLIINEIGYIDGAESRRTRSLR